VEDRTEGLTIDWRVDGKVDKITKSDGKVISFMYDGLGNRISKSEKEPDTNGVIGETKETFYNRDAQGNVLAVYQTGEPVTVIPSDALQLSGAINQDEQAVSTITITNGQIANLAPTNIVVSDAGSIIASNTTIYPGGRLKICPVEEIETGETVMGLSLTEQHIYGSSRLGLQEPNIVFNGTTILLGCFYLTDMALVISTVTGLMVWKLIMK